MNEQDQPRSDEPAFDDPAFDELRALLAGARVTDPVPEDVAARLDATLSSLQAERRADPGSDSGADSGSDSGADIVVPLRHRLRRGAGRVLVAAAVLAVVGVGGVGIAQLSGDSSMSADKATSADRAQDDAGGGSSTGGMAPEATSATGDVPRASRAVPELTAEAFAADAARVMVDLATDQELASLDQSPTRSPSGTAGDLDTGSPAKGYVALKAPAVTATPQELTDSVNGPDTCAGPEAPGAVTVPATLDGGLVALVFRPPADSAQRVEAWSCNGATLLESATVPTATLD